MNRMNFEKETTGDVEKQERPGVLYHASHNPAIEEFVPRQDRVRDPNEGPRVFATPDKALASIFLIAGQNDDWIQSGYLNDVPIVVVCMEREEFIAHDKGGAIYVLPSDGFDFDPNLGLRDKEWTNPNGVKPLGKIGCESALDTMIENGVQVYFVDKTTFDAIDQAENFGVDILTRLESENQRRGVNVQDFQMDSKSSF